MRAGLRALGLIAALCGCVSSAAAQLPTYGTLGALNATVATNPGTAVGVTLTVSGTFVGTITFQCDANGGGTYSSVLATNIADGTTANTTTTTGTFSIANTGCLSLQAKMTAYTSGSATVTVFRAVTVAKTFSSVARTVSASNTGTQVGATALNWGVNTSDATPSGPGYSLRLPAATGTGKFLTYVNGGAFPTTLYPAVGDQIDLFGVNGGYEAWPNNGILLADAAAGQWYLIQQLPFLWPIYNAFTAHAGGGQGSCTATGYGTNVFRTVATAGDSGCLPNAFGGLEQVWYFNKGAASMNLFPLSGQEINALGANVAIAIAAGSNALCLDIGPPNQWVCK